VISETLGVPDVNKSGWFKHSMEKLETTIRPAYSKCKHFESSGIGETEAEKEKLRSWKKQCSFCKVLSKRSRSAEQEVNDTKRRAANAASIHEQVLNVISLLGPVSGNATGYNSFSDHIKTYSDTLGRSHRHVASGPGKQHLNREQEESDSHDNDQTLTLNNEACKLVQQIQHAPDSNLLQQAFYFLSNYFSTETSNRFSYH
jgi:hypothetical protein